MARAGSTPVRRVVLPLAIALALLAAAFSGASLAEDYAERSRVVVVEVPVQVTLDGQPVRGLTADDFVLLDGKKPQRISGFNVLDLTLSGPARDEPRLDTHVSVAARRHFLLLFDLTFSTTGSLGRAREAIREWVIDELHPWDLVAVAVYESRRGARLLLNFTSDRDQVDLAVATIGAPRFYEASIDPLGLEIGAASARFSEIADSALTARGGSRGSSDANDQDVLDTLSLIYYGAYEPLARKGERHQIQHLTESLGDLAGMMQGVRGRKYVVFLSEGFDSSLVFATDQTSEVERLNTASERGEMWNIDPTKRFGSIVAQNDLSTMVERFRRADCVIQAIDIGGSEQPGSNRSLGSQAANGLFYMAHETGGELYRSFNQLDQAIERMLTQTSVTYVLAFQPEELEFNDKFHKLRVKLKNGPKGARVTHRPGYYAPAPYKQQSEMERRLSAAQNIMEGRDQGELQATVLAAAFRDADGPAYVPLLVEIDGMSLPIEAGREQLALEIYAYALDEAGRIAGFLTQRLAIDLAKLQPELRERGLKFFGDLELGPGSYSLRVLVRESESGMHATRAITLEVPEHGPAILPPFFPEPRGKWLLARQSSGADGPPERPFPFMYRDQPYLPAARPVVDAHGEADLFLVAYRLGEGPLSLAARVVDPLGTVLASPRIHLLDQSRDDATQRDVLLARLAPDGIAAGEYRLLVTVANDRTGQSETSSIPLVVVQRERVTEVPGSSR